MTRPQLVREGTTVDDMLRVVSDEIVAGHWPPGTKLDAQGLAERFAVSRTPVREMFGHLTAMGLTERRPNRGVIVATISEEGLDHLFEAMAELEAACVGLCTQRMSDAQKQQLVLAHERSAKLASEGSTEDYEAFNLEFHNLLYAGSHNPYLQELAIATRARLRPFRRAQFFLESRPARSHEEHERIVAAILASDVDAATTAARKHLMKVRDSSQTVVESQRHRHRPS
ncbi:GntR family transcriptional regulator [Salinicola peritrichatus]|uniref:GntR family transcriptional regulator n=1 Tax=Salinicola peritrichatus TaxID=1267424 RepID=UPI000DA13ACE|nr:GntR family transcriptional regulator [Salinicola peritrichatus]